MFQELPKKFPGPCIVWSDEKAIFVGTDNKIAPSAASANVVAAVVLGVYYILNIAYPRCFRQVLGFLQGILTDSFLSDQLRGKQLRSLKSYCSKDAL